jgi:hypothetical protein
MHKLQHTAFENTQTHTDAHRETERQKEKERQKDRKRKKERKRDREREKGTYHLFQYGSKAENTSTRFLPFLREG